MSSQAILLVYEIMCFPLKRDDDVQMFSLLSVSRVLQEGPSKVYITQLSTLAKFDAFQQLLSKAIVGSQF